MRWLALVFLCSSIASAQPDSIDYFVNWEACGLTADFTLDGTPEYYFDEMKADMDPRLNDAEVLETIFREQRGGGIIFFLTGPYIFDRGIRIPSNFVLSGKHRDSTFFLFEEMEESKDLFLAEGKLTKEEYVIDFIAEPGSDYVDLMSTHGLRPNDWVWLKDADDELITSSWAKGKTGQIVQVRKTNGKRVFFSSNVRRAYNKPREARLIKFLPAENVGITDVTILNSQETDIQTSTIEFRYAVNCFVSGIRSKRSNYAHVQLEFAANCLVLNSDFKDGHSYGSGGKAYGVVVQFASSECLIEGNQFNHLRHAMICQAGANGNVFRDNHSKNPYWKEPFLPKRAAGDLVLHGNYPYYNLFLQNTVQNLVIDRSHGINGPNNFFVQNRIESYGILMSKKQATNGCYFLENVISGKGLFKGKYRIKGENHVEAGNYVKGQLVN